MWYIVVALIGFVLGWMLSKPENRARIRKALRDWQNRKRQGATHDSIDRYREGM